MLVDRPGPLGGRRLIWPRGQGVQWNPADERCVAGEIRLVEGDQWALSRRPRLGPLPSSRRRSPQLRLDDHLRPHRRPLRADHRPAAAAERMRLASSTRKTLLPGARFRQLRPRRSRRRRAATRGAASVKVVYEAERVILAWGSVCWRCWRHLLAGWIGAVDELRGERVGRQSRSCGLEVRGGCHVVGHFTRRRGERALLRRARARGRRALWRSTRRSCSGGRRPTRRSARRAGRRPGGRSRRGRGRCRRRRCGGGSPC